MSTPTTIPTSGAEIALPDLSAHIVKTPGVCGGKARINGTRIRVQDVYVWHELQGKTVDAIVTSFPQLTHAQVHTALAYYFSRSEEVRALLAEDERYVDELKKQTGPGPLAAKLDSLKQHGQDDQVSS